MPVVEASVAAPHSILITGASRGIGRALALRCARSGEYRKMILTCVQNETGLRETAREAGLLCPELRLCTSAGDIGNPAFAEDLRRRFGPVDTLVNNAAVSWTGLLTDMPPEKWEETLRVNVTGLYATCRAFVPEMVRSRAGCILNLSSVWGRVGASCEVAYSASKGAVDAFTRALAKELAPSGITVNAAAPGMVDTEMNRHLSPAEKEEIRGEIPAGYIASPEEAAEALFRLLWMPPYFTGEIVRLDGGWQ